MKIHLPTLKAWARLKPPENISNKAKRAWRRFALVHVNGRPLAVPAKAAAQWMRHLPEAEATLVGDALQLRAGTSRAALKCYVFDVPAEKPWTACEATYWAPYAQALDHVSLADMAGQNF